MSRFERERGGAKQLMQAELAANAAGRLRQRLFLNALTVLPTCGAAAQFDDMSTLTKSRAKKPAPKKALKATKAARALRSPKLLASGKPTAGFLAGTITIGPAFDPQAPVYAGDDWKA